MSDNKPALKKESTRSKRKYRAFSQDKKGRNTYWSVFFALLNGKSHRYISKQYGVSKEMIHRVRHSIIKVRNSGWFLVIYLVTISSYKLVSWYISTGWLQLLISGVMTAAIIALSYKEIMLEEKDES